MPRINPLTNPTGATAATLSAVKSKLGMVPNLFATLAVSPVALNGYLALSEATSKGVLTAAQREIVALAVAETNACDYCLAAHSAIGQGAGLNSAQIQAARLAQGGNPKEHALASLARRITETRGNISDGELAQFKAIEGFDDAVVLEVITLVALNTLTNYVNHIAQTTIDFPAVAPAIAA